MPITPEYDPQNLFFRCVEDCSEAIMFTDTQDRLIYVNPAWQSIYGYTREEAIGQSPRILHSGHHPKSFYEEMWDAIRNPEIAHWKGEVINRAKDGTIVPVLLTITPFKSPSGETHGYMGIALDVSSRKELEAKVAQQDRLASIGLLASGLAHEVGTPLGVIRGRAEFLLMQASEQLLRKNLEVIVSQIDRISKLIQSLLRISRGTTTPRLEEVQLAAVIDDVMALVAQNLRADNVAAIVEIPEGLRAFGDFNRLQQVFLNLLMNSVYAIRKAIRDGRKEPHRLAIEASRRGRKIAIEVRDTGCGISPEDLNKIFKPFFTTKDVGEGTGLGLAIVAQLLHEMKGEISVESTQNQGTAFTILLDPIDPAPSDPTQVP
ncbi:MAG: ATP-binding protein [Oligoflexia bacterium]|nr:ATP-binding protein [Oligoflexia bacterium]